MLRILNLVICCLIVATCAARTDAGQAPNLTPEQKEKLKLRDQHQKDAIAALRAGKAAEARTQFEKILAIEQEVFGEAHDEVAGSLSTLTDLCLQLEDFPSARDYAKKNLALCGKLHGEAHWATIDARLKLEDIELRAGLPKEKRASLDKASRLNVQGIQLTNRREAAKAEPLFKEALQIQKEILGEKHPDCVSTLTNLGASYFWQGAYAKAEPFYREAVRITKESHGEKHPVYALHLNNLAQVYGMQALYEKAEPLYEEALKIRKEVFGEKHPTYANSLNDLATVYQSRGLYEKAEPLFQEALKIRKAAMPAMPREYGQALNNLAGLYYAQGLYGKAVTLFQESLRVTKAALGDKHPDYAACLGNLAEVYRMQALYEKAEPMYLESLRITKAVLGEKHPEYAIGLNNLAENYRVQALYAKAEPLYEAALQVVREALGEKHPYYVAFLNNLAALYEAQGLYLKAGTMFIQSMKISKQIYGDKHLNYALTVNNVAQVFKQVGEYVTAEQQYKEALEIHKAILGEKHPKYAVSLNNLASLYESQRLFAKAEPLYEEALRIHRAAPGDIRAYAASLNNLAGLYQKQGLFSKAEQLYQEATQIFKDTFGERHPDYSLSLNNLALLYRKQGLHAKAEPLYKQAIRIVEDHLEQTAAAQSEFGQLMYASKVRLYFENLFYLPGTDPAELYAIAFRWRGATTARQTFARAARATDASARATVDELRDVAEKLTYLVTRMPKAGQQDDVSKVIEQLHQQREALEKKLATQSKDFARYQANRALTPADLQKLLPDDAVLVDFMGYGDKMAAFVVTRQSIARVDLTGGRGLAELVIRFRSDANLNLKRPARETGSEKEDIRKVVWEPLVPHLKSARIVLICPDGPLCWLPFAALRGSDSKKYLIEEVALAVVPVPRLLPELLSSRPASASGLPSLLLVGDVDFNGGAGPAKSPERTVSFRGGRDQWQALPGTRIEINAIESLFREQSKGASIKLLSQAEATQTAVRREAGSYRYVHLATHGEFARRSALQDSGLSEAVRSRLVLAGANNPTGVDGGALSALEIGEMDLGGVELAVLSACETGLGRAQAGEGVLGLQRAFMFAGARTTVTSLWQIPDGATAPLMVRFYENRLKKGLSPLEALREAQLWVLNEGVAAGVLSEPPGKGLRTPPICWAAFVLAGDWR